MVFSISGKLAVRPIFITVFSAIALAIFAACQAGPEIIPTPLPTIAAPSGWTTRVNGEFQISLPDSFISVSNVDVQERIEQVAALGPEYEQWAATIQAQSSAIVIAAVDQNRPMSSTLTNVMVAKESVRSTMTIAGYLNSWAGNLSSQHQVLQQEELLTGRYPTGLLMAEASAASVGAIRQVAYAVKNGSAIWQIVFTTPEQEYEQRLPEFELAMTTVSVPYTPESSQSGTTNFLPPVIMLLGLSLLIVAAIIDRNSKRRRLARAQEGSERTK